MKRSVKCLFFWCFLFDLQGQSVSILRLMQQDSAFDLFLTLDWKELQKKKKEKAYIPAHLKFLTDDGDSLSMDLKVRTRGHMRLEICYYPPLKLKLDKNELAAHSFTSHNEIDLVHHCQNDDQYDQFILREYLAYKLYQVVSPYSYHVQLVRIHYINPDGSVPHEPSIGFMVENSEELADRLGGKRNKTDVMSQNAVDRESLLRVCLFQYMIGNTDWYIRNRHNLEFMGVPGRSFLVAIPYDFDYSGLVAAHYAVHHESIKLPSVTVRYYQGRCESEEAVSKILNEFLEKKDILLNMCSQIQGMNERSVKHTRSFLEDFFTIIENPKKMENNILKHCDMWPAVN